MQNKRGYVAVMYKSLRQNNTEFGNFFKNADNLPNIVNKSSSLFTVIPGDCNAKSTSWWVDNKTTTVGTLLEALTTFHGFQQLIPLPTYILPNSNSCVYFIFTG